MRYYLKTIEQTLTGEEGAKTLGEYGNITSKATETLALSAYYEGLTTISKDLWTPETPNKKHTYYRTSIEDSYGNIIESKTLGAYLAEVPALEPEPVEPES